MEAQPSRRVLVVDDNQDLTDAVAMTLELVGHRVATARDGAKALEMAKEFQPEVVVLDIRLEGMDGYEVARRLREQSGSSSMVLVAITGLDHPDERRRALQAGFDHHLVKPVDPLVLLKLLSPTPS
jgi:CheY-like chemotaxis protein